MWVKANRLVPIVEPEVDDFLKVFCLNADGS